MPRNLAAAGICVVALLLASPARASVIEWTFTGQVTNIFAPLGPALGIAIGDPFTLVVSLESSTPAAFTSPHAGVYPGAVLSSLLSVGGLSVPGGTGDVQVLDWDIPNLAPSDYLRLSSSWAALPPVNGWQPVGFSLELFDNTAAAFHSIALPDRLPLLSTFFGTVLFADYTSPDGSGVFWRGIVTDVTPVPEPAALTLLAIGGLALSRRAKVKRLFARR